MTEDEAMLALAWLHWHTMVTFSVAATVALAPAVALLQDRTSIAAYWRYLGVEAAA